MASSTGRKKGGYNTRSSVSRANQQKSYLARGDGWMALVVRAISIIDSIK